MARKPSGMHPEEIKARICMKWGTMTAFQASIGRNGNAVSNAIRQPGYSVPLERLIAAELGKTPQEVFPDRYHDDGSPVAFRSFRMPTARPTAGQRRKEVTA